MVSLTVAHRLLTESVPDASKPPESCRRSFFSNDSVLALCSFSPSCNACKRKQSLAHLSRQAHTQTLCQRCWFTNTQIVCRFFRIEEVHLVSLAFIFFICESAVPPGHSFVFLTFHSPNVEHLGCVQCPFFSKYILFQIVFFSKYFSFINIYYPNVEHLGCVHSFPCPSARVLDHIPTRSGWIWVCNHFQSFRCTQTSGESKVGEQPINMTPIHRDPQRDNLDIIHHWLLTQHLALDRRVGYCVSPSAPRWYQTQLFLTHPHYVRSSATWIMKLSHVFLGIAQQWVGGGLCSPSEIFVVQVVHQGNDLVMTLSAHDHLQKKQIMVWQRS